MQVNTGNKNTIAEWEWQTVYPDKKGIVTIIYDEKYMHKLQCKELNYKIKELNK